MKISQTRSVFTQEQEQFRNAVRGFLNDHVVPEYSAWLADGKPSRRFWRAAAEIGILGIGVPEQFGGMPGSDYRHSVVVTEEIQALGLAIGGLRVQTDICLPYLLHHGSPNNAPPGCRGWLPVMLLSRSDYPSRGPVQISRRCRRGLAGPAITTW